MSFAPRPLAVMLVVLVVGCRAAPGETSPEGSVPPGLTPDPGPACILVDGDQGVGPEGSVPVGTEVVAANLEVPWGLAWLPNGDLLVTERPGRVRKVSGGLLDPTPVALVETSSAQSESGLLGIALSPEVATNRRMFLYVTVGEGDALRNEVQRWILSEDFASASFDRVIFGDIPASRFHDGGRLRFGPDGQLYVGTGDASDPDRSQELDSPLGKILRLTEDGAPAPGNPFEGRPVFMLGLRNTQGFDWFPGDPELLAVTDHGPSGELGRRTHDEVNVGRAGENFGWPDIYRCESAAGLTTPSITFEVAVPPGGAAFYTGEGIPEWKGSLLVGSLGSTHLHRVEFNAQDPRRVSSHEVYFKDTLGRIREVVMGPDGELYITTSNCDGRGPCGVDKDKVLRVVRGR